ncbi:hypothetical protein SAMN06297129_3674 [Pseudooceanicola antarcticus]|uniref:Uncharacterized protein n=2 Tax=Pseudooceanicola antarcticus TaxID=1247613 RepID=A0A285JFG1_9RHOB|nr:hypothetical protein CVM39_04185 [Pseudooceanicola antarcticus]SNY59012.1 hypothetical protein SAMN06297129_3674 [Pseudooceanicola antarcticus]
MAEPAAEPANLRLLRRLVTLLLVVMILGLITLVGLIVIRFARPPAPALPAEITLPEGTKAEAVTQGRGWYAVVTADQRLLIFDTTGTLRQDIAVQTGPTLD